jgi:hypothetical protein
MFQFKWKNGTDNGGGSGIGRAIALLFGKQAQKCVSWIMMKWQRQILAE